MHDGVRQGNAVELWQRKVRATACGRQGSLGVVHKQGMMDMMNAFKTAFAAVTLGMMVAMPAAAATVTVLNSSAQGSGNTAGIDFAQEYGAYTPINASWSADPTFTPPSGNAAGQSQSPFNSNALTDNRAYFTVGGVAEQGGAPSPVTLTFQAMQTAFNILWGSIDSYNSIAFFSGTNQVASYTGDDIVALGGLGGTAANFEKVALLYFSNFDGGFDSVQFSSSSQAFEFALVPVPAAGFLLLGALGGLAALRRRKTA